MKSDWIYHCLIAVAAVEFTAVSGVISLGHRFTTRSPNGFQSHSVLELTEHGDLGPDR